MPPLHGIDGSASGTSTPALSTGQVVNAGCLSLSEYATIIEYDEHRFWGVLRNDFLQYQCREYWYRGDRQTLQHYLTTAQQMFEHELHYKLCPTWVTDEEHPFGNPILSKFDHLIEAGVQASSDIETDSPVNHATDPAVVGPIATAVTDESEIVIYHPGTSEVIEPQSIVISGGQVTVYIPRCRLVPIASQYDSVDYSVTDDFLQTVDVVRVYNDPSTNAVLVWPHTCSAACSDGCSCTETTQTACMVMRNKLIGEWGITPATYSSGWSAASLSCNGLPYTVRLNYRSGLPETTRIMKDGIIRLAHSLMPAPPCGCETIKRLWKRDRNVPLVTDRERLNCPWGLSDGAWFAWNLAVSNESGWMGVL